jgi:hypothetical protein
MKKAPFMSEKPRPFNPSPALAASIATNRAGRLTGGQKRALLLGAGVSVSGLGCIGFFLLNVGLALGAGLGVGNWVSGLFFIFFLLSFAYLGLTLYFNASWFVPDALSRHTVQTARGKLVMRPAERERFELPFSYLVGDYSFAPYVVPYEVPLEVGREYIVYYAAHSRMFLNIEPVDVQP